MLPRPWHWIHANWGVYDGMRPDSKVTPDAAPLTTCAQDPISVTMPLCFETIKRLIRRTPLAPVLRGIRARWQLERWRRHPKPGESPPHLLKQLTVRDYARRHQTSILVETGTYLGDMVEAQRREFRRIYSIELNPALAAQAKRRFARWQHIVVIEGDSGEQLPALLPQLQDPCLFWLDGHYSGGITARGTLTTPVRDELKCILATDRTRDVILIDDARFFTGADDYPTVAEIGDWVRKCRPGWIVDVCDDIIRLHGTPPPLTAHRP